MEIYFKEKYVRCTYFRLGNYILFKWNRLDIHLEDLQELHAKALDVIRHKHVKSLIADTSDAERCLYDECIDWWTTVQVPLLTKAGVTLISTVRANKALTRFTNEQWQKPVKGTITNIECNSLDEAIDYSKRNK